MLLLVLSHLVFTTEVGSVIFFIFHKTQRICPKSHSTWLCLIITYQPVRWELFLEIKTYSQEVTQLGFEPRAIFTAFAFPIIKYVELTCFQEKCGRRFETEVIKFLKGLIKINVYLE